MDPGLTGTLLQARCAQRDCRNMLPLNQELVLWRTEDGVGEAGMGQHHSGQTEKVLESQGGEYRATLALRQGGAAVQPEADNPAGCQGSG